jgi:O-antigen ligase
LDKSDAPTNIHTDGRHRVRQQILGPAGLALAAVLVLCVVAPPEVRGSGLAAVALFIAVAASAVSSPAASSPASRWLFAMILSALLAVRMAIAPGEAVEPVVCMLLAALAGISAAHAAENDELFARMFAVLVAFAGGRALYEATWGLAALADHVRESVPAGDALAVLNRLEQGRPYGGFATPAALGCFLVMTVPAVASWAFGKQGRFRAMGLAAAAIGAAGLVATRSVTAMAALAIAVAMAGMRGLLAPRVVAASAGAIGLAMVLAGIMRPDAVFAPIREDSPWRLRAGNVRVGLEIARDHPLAGVGPGGFAEAFPQYRRAGDNESRHAHDLPAELVAEWGVPAGLALSALFFWIFVGPVVSGTGDPRTLASGLTVGLAAFAIHNLADFTAFLPSLLLFAAVCRGLIAHRVVRDRAAPVARVAFIAAAVVLLLFAAGAGLARDALFHAREEANLGDDAAALRFAVRAERLAPWDADPPQFAAEARMAARANDATALKDAESAVRRAPSRAAARVVRARARTASGDSAGAYADLVEASRLYPLKVEYATQRDALAAAMKKAREAAPR